MQCRIDYRGDQYYEGGVRGGKYNGEGEVGNSGGILFKGIYGVCI